MHFDDKFTDIAADLVTDKGGRPFLKRLHTSTPGQWLNVTECDLIPSSLKTALEKLHNSNHTTLYAIWLPYPEARNSEEEFCIISFFADRNHWSNLAIFNRAYFFANE